MRKSGRDRDDLRCCAVVGFAENGFASLLFPRAPFSELDSPEWGTARFGVSLCRLHGAVEEVRKELRRIVENNEKWRGQVCVLQVTDATTNAIQLRALVDARDAGTAWDLRCEVREKLIQFLQEKYPRGVPRVRTEFQEFPTGSVNPSSEPLASAASIRRRT